MLRRVIEIDQDKCTGCGLCVDACHEGAIALVDGKAQLIRDDYCDGLGDCLPACPEDAIRFVEREAAPYDEAAVQAAQAAKKQAHAGGCPGSRARSFNHDAAASEACAPELPSCLSQWPVQIKLLPPQSPLYDGADLLIAADCTAFSYGNFHKDFIDGHICLVGCPKLDEGDYTEKLSAIITNNDVRSVRVARMEVPCCGGIERAARQAVALSGKDIPVRVTTISADGRIVAES